MAHILHNAETADKITPHFRHNGAQLKIVRDHWVTLFNSMNEVLFLRTIVPFKQMRMSAACEKLYGYTPVEFFEDPDLYKKLMQGNANT